MAQTSRPSLSGRSLAIIATMLMRTCRKLRKIWSDLTSLAYPLRKKCCVDTHIQGNYGSYARDAVADAAPEAEAEPAAASSTKTTTTTATPTPTPASYGNYGNYGW